MTSREQHETLTGLLFGYLERWRIAKAQLESNPNEQNKKNEADAFNKVISAQIISGDSARNLREESDTSETSSENSPEPPEQKEEAPGPTGSYADLNSTQNKGGRMSARFGIVGLLLIILIVGAAGIWLGSHTENWEFHTPVTWDWREDAQIPPSGVTDPTPAPSHTPPPNKSGLITICDIDLYIGETSEGKAMYNQQCPHFPAN